MAGDEGESSGAVAATMVSIRIAGSWSGVLQVPVELWGVGDMRAEISRLTGFEAETINLIFAGKTLKDDFRLNNIGLKPNAKILMTRIGKQQVSALIEEKERVDRLDRIKKAAESMSNRLGEPSPDYEVVLQNQRGENLDIQSDSSKRAVVEGMILFARSQKLIKKSQFKDALDLLMLAEESFAMGDMELLRVADNVPLVQIDIVWCLFMLQDIGGLGIAQDRLAKARTGLQHAHGQNLERLRAVQGKFCPELATYVRLELLEGVVAYHSGDRNKARKHLEAALEKAQKLDISDESLAQLVGMGFKAIDAKRALRAGQDVESAVAFLMDQKKKREERRQEDRDYREQQLYGKTKSGKPVNLKQLNALSFLGYERFVVAEALRQTDNDNDKALDILANPVTLAVLQQTLSTSKRARRSVTEEEIGELTRMGFDRQSAIHTLGTSRDWREALEKLIGSLQEGASSSNPPIPITGTNPGSNPPINATNDVQPAPEQQQIDEEMENEIAKDITGDPLEDYDLEVGPEKDAIEKYLVMLNSENDM